MPRAPVVVHRLFSGFLADSGQLALMCVNSARDLRNQALTASSPVFLIAEQVLILGIRSISLVFVAGIAAGAIMALQLGHGLQRFGGSNYTPSIVGISVLRELGPILTGLLLAGRVGSGITAELASMSVTEQIDAIRTLGASPLSTLVAPRVIACLLALPVLTLLADSIGLISAMLISKNQFSIPSAYFLSKVVQILHPADLYTGLVKSVVFGLIISVVACWKGINTTGGTRGVGNATTQVVVTSSILILIADIFLSKLFIALGVL